ncbi:MAG: DUF455 family protein [Verrucomicrobiae bacterium]|nr:DUF455 family protein [Verrucomicrobiae bacterium]
MKRSSPSFAWKNELENGAFPEEDADVSESPGSETLLELAERVLFSTDLREKLRPAPLASAPDESREQGARTVKGILTPTRPDELRFASSSKARPSLPGRPGLVDDKSRGVLLHFFANHELLAAELMALALLKFPEAPPDFRRGLASTLREEQRHTRWYLARMKECGVTFGEYPLSPYFWDAVSPMETPLDYVSRLSLTFEQANLDYARHYGEILAEAGDARSASILRRIYEDEIFHVGYGLHWFRQWKNPGESDWSALKKRLPFPLSPSRAKGNRTGFNEEGRRAAGFDEDYIRQLALFERSKGRTPNVLCFNPEAEHRIARWPAPYHPDAARLAVVEDLEILIGFLARRDDVILLRRRPSDIHLAKLAAFGLALPEIEMLTPEGFVDPSSLLAKRKIDRLLPWALAPDLGDRLSALTQVARPGRSQDAWNVERSRLFSKVAQSENLARWMGPSFPCRDSEDLRSAAEHLSAFGHREFVLKRAFSTAGSGLQRCRREVLDDLTSRPLSDAVVGEGGILLEPKHERVFDFSVQYRIVDGAIRLSGFVEQVIRGLGGYRGSICRTKFCKGLEPELARFLMEKVLPLYSPEGELASNLLAWASHSGYEGPLGVDAYVHRCQESGALSLRPVCEVNPRHTMGLVALELKRRIAPGKSLSFAILKTEDLTEEDGITDEAGRLVSGSLVLTEPSPESRFSARITVF